MSLATSTAVATTASPPSTLARSNSAESSSSVVASPVSGSVDNLSVVSGEVSANEEIKAAGLPLDPADVLTDRARGWRSIVNTLYNHFSAIADAEKALAKCYKSVAQEWNTPSQSRELAFSEKSGVRGIVRVLHDEADKLSSQHMAVSTSLASQTVTSLAAIKKEVKKKLDTLEDEQRKRNKDRIRDKNEMIKAKEHLQKALAAARKPGSDATKHGDPWLANLEVRRKLAQARAKHEARTVALVDIKRDFSVFEANVIREIRQALQGVASLQEIQDHRQTLADEITRAMAALDAGTEWQLFGAARLDAAGGPAMFEGDDYEGSKDPLVQVIKEGLLQRRAKGLIKNYKEFYYVLTSAGYLHEFKQRPVIQRDEKVDPDDSIFMGDCTLEPYKAEDRKPEEFIMTEKKEDGNMFQRASKTFKFLGSSMTDTKEWHEALSSTAKTTLGVVATGATSAVGRSNTITSSSVQSMSETVTRSVTVETKKTSSG